VFSSLRWGAVTHSYILAVSGEKLSTKKWEGMLTKARRYTSYKDSPDPLALADDDAARVDPRAITLASGKRFPALLIINTDNRCSDT
jgi:hypothetical protein